MNKRKFIITGAGVLILVLSFAISGRMKRADPPRPAGASMATAVNAIPVQPGAVMRKVPITGRLVPAQTVNIFAEVGGLATYGDKPFKPGTRFAKGEVMVRINSDEARTALYAARSAFQSALAGIVPDLKLDFADKAAEWESYLYQLRIEQNLPPLPETNDKKLNLFLSGRGIYTNYYSIREAETRYAKFTITAPFDGVLSTAQIDAASLVRTGQPLGEFISTGRFELEAGVSYTDAMAIKPGIAFEMNDVNTGREFNARVLRINEAVDPTTQQVRIYAEVTHPEARSGMYLEGAIGVQQYDNAVEIPVQALVESAKVYVVRDTAATLLPVQVQFKNSSIAIITGIDQPELLITDRHTEAFQGSKVDIVNTAR
jgi:multidrug efflux pump subunit AcrA (membrane-fusion protein)